MIGGPSNGNGAISGLHERKRKDIVARTAADARGWNAIDQQIGSIHSRDKFCESDRYVRKGKHRACSRSNGCDMRRHGAQIGDVGVELGVPTKVAATSERLVKALNGEHICAADKISGRIREGVANVSSPNSVRLVYRAQSNSVVGHFTGADIVAQDFDTVKPGNETVVTLGAEKEVCDRRSVRDKKSPSEVDGRVIVLHVAEESAGILHAVVRIAVVKRGERIRPGGVVEARPAPCIARVGRFRSSFDEEPETVGLDQNGSTVERVTPCRPGGSCVKGVWRSSQIGDAVIGSPGNVHRAGSRLRKAESVTKPGCFQSGGRSTVNEQVTGIYSRYRLTESNGDLREICERGACGRISGGNGGRRPIQNIISPTRAGHACIEGERRNSNVHDAIIRNEYNVSRSRGWCGNGEYIIRTTAAYADCGCVVDCQIGCIHASDSLAKDDLDGGKIADGRAARGKDGKDRWRIGIRRRWVDRDADDG